MTICLKWFTEKIAKNLATSFIISKEPLHRIAMISPNILKPPSFIHMKKLERKLFVKEITAPCLKVPEVSLEKIRPAAKPYLLKMPKLKPVIIENQTVTLILNPEEVRNWDDIEEQDRNRLIANCVTEENFSTTPLRITYDNWNADDIIKAVIPPGTEIARSFSKVGHIIHLNLRDHLLDYKQIIGEVLLDKIPATRTVVHKTNNIDNTYRNFDMEVICGEKDFITRVKENSRSFEFDFSKVYWNSRLSTEHQRIVELLMPEDVLFDVFCGVGPFAVPCAKKGCRVFANDLNPECYKWVQHNFRLNKVNKNIFQAFNKDGADFIRVDIKREIISLSEDDTFQGRVHIAMNLPAIALDFLFHFKHLLNINEINEEKLLKVLPTIHVYFFVYGTEPQVVAIKEFEDKTMMCAKDLNLSYHYVRNVSPKKDMVRLSFQPPVSYVLSGSDVTYEPTAKRLCSELVS